MPDSGHFKPTVGTFSSAVLPLIAKLTNKIRLVFAKQTYINKTFAETKQRHRMKIDSSCAAFSVLLTA